MPGAHWDPIHGQGQVRSIYPKELWLLLFSEVSGSCLIGCGAQPGDPDALDDGRRDLQLPPGAGGGPSGLDEDDVDSMFM